MLPQNSHDSPHRRQRWIELKNVGSIEIPGYGVCEIVRSERPEKGGVVTPDGGRTVLHVRRPTTDNPCGVIVNGPCEIPVNGYGRPGTRDDPMLALVADDYAEGTQVGVAANSFLLWEGYCGFITYADYDATSQTQRVIRYENCDDDMMVRATECILPGVGGSAQPQIWDSVTECWIDDQNRSEIDICDPSGWLLAITDDCFKVERDNCTSQCWRPSFPYGLTRLVKIKSEIECGACGTVTIMERGSGGSGGSGTVGDRCGMTESECEIEACNVSYRKLACDAEEFAMINVIPGPCCMDTGSGSGSGASACLAIITPFPRAMRAMATLNADMCASDAQFSEISYKDVCDWEHVSPPTSAKNPLSLHACSNTVVELEWSEGNCEWEVANVADQKLPDWVVDLRCKPNACAIEKSKKAKPWYGHYCDCSDASVDEWSDTQVTGEYVDVVVSGAPADDTGGDSASVLTGASCGTSGSCLLEFATASLSPKKIVLKTKQVCVFCQLDTLGDGDDIEIEGLVAVGATGSPIPINGREIDVLTEVQAQYSGTGGSGDGCPPGSGSGSIEGGSTGISISLTGKTKTICTFCSADDGDGGFVDGDDIDLLDGLSFSSVAALTDSDLICDPCLNLSSRTTTFWALCVAAESDVYLGTACNCYDCPPESSGST